MKEHTHGPWTGLDFDPTTNLNRTAELCPEGWVVLEWLSGEPGELSAFQAHGVLLDDALEIKTALRSANPGPVDYGLEDWPEGRRFIGRLFCDRDEDGIEWCLELLVGDDGEPVFAEPLPVAE